MRIDVDRVNGGSGLNIVIATRHRWLRFAAFYGVPPGSRIGLWQTRVGDLRGLNFRIGRRYVGPTLTLLVHGRSN